MSPAEKSAAALGKDLVFDDVSITYSSKTSRGDIPAVSNVSLELPAGSTLGIAGESGSGKSTLILSVLRLLPDNATLTGRVLLGGTDIAELNFGQMRAVRWSEAAIVFQGALHSLNPVRAVGKQILEALNLHVKDEWRSEAERKARVVSLLEQVDLDAQIAQAYPHELSGGQKQRVMIAMALACDPDIIIADEPTTALDVIVQAQILTRLRELVEARGISLLMISHDLSVLATACERIAIMKSGRIVEIGPAEQICSKPEEPYTQQLADAFPTIGDPASRLNPITRNPARVDVETPHTMTDEVVLEARSLNVTFKARGRLTKAVNNVDLKLHRSEILAVVGQSGSGKTTLARTLLGLQPPDSGSELLFQGESLPSTKRGLRRFRRDVQMILQDPSGSLNPSRSVYESVAEGLRVQKFTGDERARVRESLEAAELTPGEDFFEPIPQELSGGQRQRVVIASALALEPDVLIADEPVASLDASVRGEILSLFLALKKNIGLTALVITHDLGLAWNIADTVAVMYRGEIVEHGPVEDVLLDPQHDYTRRLLAAVPGFRAERAAQSNTAPAPAAQVSAASSNTTETPETGGAADG
ncbi:MULTISPECIES: ABC transporter ATP-binding protein [unclassified Brevibacterium]|uniref:ABC transporter ATP-binding protein n=1 Tax=unclassified Brevibacterium TaxID=2614124 RepID=UPI0008A314D9|nr:MULTISPECIES: ABC transporter ATP-binding protein [unclassified Brevibacterium]OFL65292.1 peptide ABC transporter ATP-binding protein [Brevibacterium sp. HMSC063G07]OFS25212.1 peptide ABC transporter ATP-binding protein [Brevibacterium sp. HMSC07C04]